MSAQKVSQTLLITSLVMLLIGPVMLLAPQAAVAQCEDPSLSCCTCHATAHPVFEQGEWHTIHARQECCRSCHGGNDRTDDKDAAHVGLPLHPLDDTYLACHQCHPDDYRQRAAVFAVALQVTPQSNESTAQSPHAGCANGTRSLAIIAANDRECRARVGLAGRPSHCAADGWPPGALGTPLAFKLKSYSQGMENENSRNNR